MSAGTIPMEVLSRRLGDAIDGRRLRVGVFTTFSFDPAFFELQVLPLLFPDYSFSQPDKVRRAQLDDALRTVEPLAVYYDRQALAQDSEPAQLGYGVVARIVTSPHDAHRQDPHRPMRYDSGRPRAVIRLRISQPRTTSLPCPAGLRARRPSPMMDLYRKNVFSTRP